MVFTTKAQVRFAHVDAAGIVFYPRYFEMLNAAVEDWFAQALKADFKNLHFGRKIGLPTVKIDVEFLSPSRLGDDLTISITPTEIGRSSCSLSVLFSAEGRNRLRANVKLVCMDIETQRSLPWPDDVRAGIEAALGPA